MGISVFIYDEDKNIKKNEPDLQSLNTNLTSGWNSTSDTSSNSLREDEQFFWVEMGDIMLFSSLIFDGLTGAIQEKIRAENKNKKIQKPKLIISLIMMSTLNSYASLVTLIMSLSSGEMIPAIHFIMTHPKIIIRIALLALCSSFGQICIYTTGKTLFNILLSNFNHSDILWSTNNLNCYDSSKIFHFIMLCAFIWR